MADGSTTPAPISIDTFFHRHLQPLRQILREQNFDADIGPIQAAIRTNAHARETLTSMLHTLQERITKQNTDGHALLQQNDYLSGQINTLREQAARAKGEVAALQALANHSSGSSKRRVRDPKPFAGDQKDLKKRQIEFRS
jgi:septal ring factor EnvC (AmiA/AmiB activator)